MNTENTAPTPTPCPTAFIPAEILASTTPVAVYGYARAK
jgi:hypothetical protein